MKHTAPLPVPVRPVARDAALPLERAAFCVFVQEAYSSRGLQPPASDLAAHLFAGDDHTRTIYQRTAVGGALTTTTGWAAEFAAASSGAFLASLSPASAAAAIFAMGPRVTLPKGRESGFPQRASGAVSRPWVGEGMPIAVHNSQVNRVMVGPYRKIAAIGVLSRELAEFPEVFPFFQTSLREDAARSLDSAVFSQAAASSEGHAGLLNGKTSLVPDTGTGTVAMRNDLASLAATVGAAGSGDVVFVASPGRAAKMRILAPDIEAPIFASPAVPAQRVIAVDPLSVVHADGGDPEIDASAFAAMHMEDTTPLEIVSGSGPTIAAPVVSMYQTDQIAVRMLLNVAFKPRRSGAAAFMDVENW